MRGETQRGSGQAAQAPALVRWARNVAEYPQRFRQFVHEVRVELRHVSWPTWDDVKGTTAVVIIAVFLVGAFLAIVDQIATRLVQQLFNLFRS